MEHVYGLKVNPVHFDDNEDEMEAELAEVSLHEGGLTAPAG